MKDWDHEGLGPRRGPRGSHGAAAVPLFALLWAWGRDGLASRLDSCMAASEKFAAFVDGDPRLELLCRPETGVVVWRHIEKSVEDFIAALPAGLASQTTVAGSKWLRCVAANPMVDIDAVVRAVKSVT